MHRFLEFAPAEQPSKRYVLGAKLGGNYCHVNVIEVRLPPSEPR